MTISDTEIELPDKTTIYSYERARQVYKTLSSPELTVADAILLLLYAQRDKAIYGRISLMKELFLLIHEILGKSRVQDPKYVPQRYGMYSYFVANTVSNLEFAGFMTRGGKKNTRAESFRITDSGAREIARKFLSLPVGMQENMKESRKGWDQLGCEGILRLVYEKYPEYKDVSVLKDRYAPIVWGKGRG